MGVEIPPGPIKKKSSVLRPPYRKARLVPSAYYNTELVSAFETGLILSTRTAYDQRFRVYANCVKWNPLLCK